MAILKQVISMGEMSTFLELKYGKIYSLDIHGLTKEEAKIEILHTLGTIDNFYKAILVTHGYHHGVVLKNFVRKELVHKNIQKKINVDASRTLLLLNLE